MSDTALKRDFAKRLLKAPEKPHEVALLMFPDDTAKALWIGNNWPRDLEVLEFMRELSEGEDALDLLPNKAALAGEIWKRFVKTEDNESFVKLGRLYAEIRNFIEKPQSGQTTVNVNQNKVVVMTDYKTDEELFEAMEKQQRELIDANSRRH